jgi:hypothetical protein
MLRRVSEILDYTAEELTGRNMYSLCHGEDANKLRKCHVDRKFPSYRSYYTHSRSSSYELRKMFFMSNYGFELAVRPRPPLARSQQSCALHS